MGIDLEEDDRRTADLLIHIRINVANEEICSHILSLLILAGLVHPYGLAIHFDHVQDLNGLQQDDDLSAITKVYAASLDSHGLSL